MRSARTSASLSCAIDWACAARNCSESCCSRCASSSFSAATRSSAVALQVDRQHRLSAAV
jgi:hypothetical protein